MKRLYDVVISLLAVISVTMVIMDYSNTISIDSYPYNYIDGVILVIFTIDYFARLSLSKNKKQFFKSNIFDLLAIIPVNSIFSFFRIARLVGLIGKLQKNAKKFLKTNGLIYLILICLAILCISAVMYSLAENVSLSESFWWAIATATTVGYGDISPHTAIGKFAAVLLMFVGIGFIGMLTSSITAYFTTADDDSKKILEKLDKLENEYREIKESINKIEK
ncbi:potassium channel family protein [Liquorilactobacillus mali]|uniref:potassium channel family protein n=1 Tax=Liquorilactobacillus mali TaxID=1618 RepID=UPI00264E138F|nr:potassium channel family protein [Liquorilactobacillus mali]MDN7144979.1 potassium channel family protein [Liquorilactobacillus mali]